MIEIVPNKNARRAGIGGADTWLELARLGEEYQAPKWAIHALTRALALVPDDDECRIRLSRLLYRVGRTVEAIKILADTPSFTLRSFNEFCNIAIWNGAFGTLDTVINRQASALNELRFRADLAMAYVWRFRNRHDLERANLESARIDAARRGQHFLEAEATEALNEWDVRFGDETAAARALAHGVERSSPFITASHAPAGKIQRIHSKDPREGFNFSYDVLFAGALRMFEGDANPPTLLINKRLFGLFKRSFQGLPMHAMKQGEAKTPALGAGDLHMRELPLFAREHGFINPCPARAYLKAQPEHVAMIRADHGRRSGGRPAIGLCWRSSSAVNEHFRSSARLLANNRIDFDTYLAMGNKFWRKGIPLPFFAPVINDTDLDVISLQYGLGAWEAERLAAHEIFGSLHLRPIDHFGDLDQIAAELAALDAFVSPPGGYAHLAAALGVPTFVLLNDQPPVPWIWNQRFPVYPDVALYHKQPVWRDGDMRERKYDGDWSPVIAGLHDDLRRRLKAS